MINSIPAKTLVTLCIVIVPQRNGHLLCDGGCHDTLIPYNTRITAYTHIQDFIFFLSLIIYFYYIYLSLIDY